MSMYRGKVTAVDANGVYVLTAEYGTLGPCQAVVANYTTDDMVLCVNVGDEASPELVVVGRLTGTGSTTSGSSVDNTVARYNGTGGALQGSGVTIDDSDKVTLGAVEFGSGGPRMMMGTGGPSGISAPVGSTWRQTDANATHGSLTGLLWNKVGTGTAEGTDWLPDFEGRWIAYGPTCNWTNCTVTGRYTRVGRLITSRVRVVVSGSTAYSGSLSVSTPATVASPSDVKSSSAVAYVATTYYLCMVRIGSNVSVNPIGASGAWVSFSSTVPATWADKNFVDTTFTYEAA